jgi:NADH dehydrogenase
MGAWKLGEAVGMANGLVVVIGGSGFIGRHLVQRLAARGVRVRVAVRRPERARFLQPMGDVGQIDIMQTNLRDEASVRAALRGADTVVNLCGVIAKKGAQTFESLHVTGAGRAARLAAEAGAATFVQISSIGADARSKSSYARSKAGGEAAVRQAFADATIVRPSIVFGPEDEFFNRFAALARLTPVLPLFGHGLSDAGATRFQPVFVGDVADAICRIIDDPAARGETYELGGPAVLSFRQIMELICAYTGRKRTLVPIPFAVARFEATFLQMLPSPPLTRDQVRLLEIDNVVADGAKGLADLGVTPTSVETVVPAYLARFRRPGARAA